MVDIRCSIVIPVHGLCNFTKAALLDLIKLPNSYEIIVVDNASEDDTVDIMDEFINLDSGPKVKYIYNTINRGFSGGCNTGQKNSLGEYLLFLNNDIKVKGRYSDWPEIMIEAAQDGSIVCTLGGLLNNDFDFIKEGKDLDRTKYWYASGWCLCAKREVFNKLRLNHFRDDDGNIVEGLADGCWNEKFWPAYFEDPDLSWRARKLGINYKEVDIPVHHFGRITGKKLGLSHLYKKSQRTFREEWNKK